jgi:hypothetical protein
LIQCCICGSGDRIRIRFRRSADEIDIC